MGRCDNLKYWSKIFTLASGSLIILFIFVFVQLKVGFHTEYRCHQFFCIQTECQYLSIVCVCWGGGGVTVREGSHWRHVLKEVTTCPHPSVASSFHTSSPFSKLRTVAPMAIEAYLSRTVGQ